MKQIYSHKYILASINHLLQKRTIFPAFSVLLMAAVIGLLTNFTAEDASIVFRYSRNFVETGDFVYNAGVHVSALTSPLQVFLDAGLYIFSKYLVSFHKLTGIAVTIIAVGFSVKLLKRKLSLLSEHLSDLDDTEVRRLVYFNPEPLPSEVPNRFFDTCKEPG